MSGRLPGGSPPGRRRWPMAVGAVALAALLAGCSSGPPSASRTSTRHTRSTSTTHQSTTTTTTTAPTSTTTTTTTAPTTLCQPSQLQMAVVGGTGAAGTVTTTVGMTNTSSAACTMRGYPGMQLLNSSGAPIPTTVLRGGAQFPSAAANAAPALVTLAAGASARFSIQWSDVPVGGETTCPASTKSEVTPPTDTAYGVMTLSIAPCDHGTVHVSPVYT